MNTRVTRQLEKMQRRIRRKLHSARRRQDDGRPVLGRVRPNYEIADRVAAVPHGGLGVVHELVRRTRLVERIDREVRVLAVHKPYHESDHVLNIAYNVMCGGRTLEDIELRRNDEAFLDALGVDAIPDPTTAGDFCRRFGAEQLMALMTAITPGWRCSGARGRSSSQNGHASTQTGRSSRPPVNARRAWPCRTRASGATTR